MMQSQRTLDLFFSTVSPTTASTSIMVTMTLCGRQASTAGSAQGEERSVFALSHG